MKMNPSVLSTMLLFSMVSADDPIIHLNRGCPDRITDSPDIVLTVDVPAHAVAKCKNGNKPFLTRNDVAHSLLGSFSSANAGSDCLFFKKNGSDTFTVEVAVGWGEDGSEAIQRELVNTISCAYDENGYAMTTKNNIAEWVIAPQEVRNFQGSMNGGTFEIIVLDVPDREITAESFYLGRKMRLRATDTSGTVTAFQAHSCTASNGVTSYAILRAGCGDGLVFPKSVGFETKKAQVFSPYFDAFRLRGANIIKFECNFTVCAANCDGDSCINRARRSVSDEESLVGASSQEMVIQIPMLHETPVSTFDLKSPSDAFIKMVDAHNMPRHFISPQDKPETYDLHVILVMSVFGSLLLVTFLVSLYLCCKHEIVGCRNLAYV